MQTFDKACILAVDDTADNLQLIHAVLAKDYSLRAATSGEKALAMLDQGLEPDLILLDVMMPGIDGFETCHRLKQHPRSAQIPVIFISAKNEVIDEQTGFELGAVDYISKPISPAILKVRIANQLALANQARQLQQLVKLRTRELEQTRHKIINRLGRAAEYRDNETGLHVQRMSHYCRVLTRQLGASESWVELLFNAAPMHDIGKIGIPDHILLKPGKLTPEEYRIMQGHTKIGADILGDDASPLLQMAAEVARSHHERWDGNGYPEGLQGNAIPLSARIAAIADVFDALTSERPYKSAWSNQEAFAYLKKEAGGQFDPELVAAFCACEAELLDIQQRFAEQQGPKIGK
ncbi:HD-GYP domain-containing protein [Shewanella algae]|uniref:HD-GYP domain-containing protein n=1 Tax=Shewanella algae TaxID=38313 RepID=UPI000BB63DA1|nr:two-component system response regulator [Shewanella algae]PBQ29852.1 two-component system response regulator [Shewanella algae]